MITPVFPIKNEVTHMNKFFSMSQPWFMKRCWISELFTADSLTELSHIFRYFDILRLFN